MICIDRSIPKGPVEALKLVREDVFWLEDRFDHRAKDPEWLRVAGLNGWLVILRDKHIRSRPGERRAIEDYQVGCFVLGQKQSLNRWQYLKLIVLTLDEMERRFAETERRFIYIIDSAGNFRQVLKKQA
ncbi:MAG: hypothetical protein ACR2PL_17325 [Dehalococcoidia bacterium]